MIVFSIAHLNIDQPFDSLVVITFLESQQIDDLIKVGAVCWIERLGYLCTLLDLIDPIQVPKHLGISDIFQLLVVKFDAVSSILRKLVDVGVINVCSVLGVIGLVTEVVSNCR